MNCHGTACFQGLRRYIDFMNMESIGERETIQLEQNANNIPFLTHGTLLKFENIERQVNLAQSKRNYLQ